MVDDNVRPLVTFYVMAFNQERFIREAVEAALRQTYSPLEIVLSDDCSTDDTFAIIQEVVKRYAGPHKIVLNRNERNLGVSGHLNRIMELATGELIVAADGDDVSRPERTARSVDVWLNHGKPAAVVAGVSSIDATGRPTRDGQWFARFLPVNKESRADSLIRFSKEGSPALSTCSAAVTREMCDAFGPLPRGIWFEDTIISLRAWLFDRIVYIPDTLVDYREHETNICNRVYPPLTTLHARHEAEHSSRTDVRWRREALMGYAPDLELAVQRRWITRATYEEIKRQVDARCACYQVIEEWWSVGWFTRLGRFLVFIGSGQLIEARWCGPRLLPFRLFIRLAATWSQWTSGGKKRIAPAWPPSSNLVWIYSIIDSWASCLALL